MSSKHFEVQTGRSRVRFPMASLEFFSDIILPVALWPWSRLSLQQKWLSGVFPEGRGGRCVRLTTLPTSCAVVMKSGNLNLLEPSWPLQACNGTDLPLFLYTGCPRRNVPDFGRAFLMLKYTNITLNTYVQSWTVTEIMAREKCGLLAGPRTVPVSWQHYPCPSLNVMSYYGNSAQARSKRLMYSLLGDKVGHVSAWHSCHV